MRNKEKYVLLKGSAGLGNRIGALIGAIVYAKITGRTLIIDWRDGIYADYGTNSFYNLFEIRGLKTIKEIPEIESSSVYPKVWKNNLNLSVHGLKRKQGEITSEKDWHKIMKEKYSLDLSKTDYKNKILVLYDWFFDFKKLENNLSKLPKEWQKDREELMKYVIKEHIVIRKKIIKKANKFIDENFKRPVIGIHIRDTDNKKDSSYFHVNTSKFERVINKELNKNPKSALLLATDNKDIKEEYKKKYRNLIIYDKEFSKNQTIGLHKAKDLEKEKMAEDALLEMYLLSKCNSLIYSGNSTYARMAITLSNINKERLIEVKGDNTRFIKELMDEKNVIKTLRTVINLVKIKKIQKMGLIGQRIKRTSPTIYSKLKPYFPDK
jgi:hypothetical protein